MERIKKGKGVMKKMTKKGRKIDMESDETVQEYIRTWDVINCDQCGREMSLQNAVSINDGEYFLCDTCANRMVKKYARYNRD